jgi:hypothetical protein
MKIIIPGGSGQIGTVLARNFQASGHEVVVLGRSSKKVPWRLVKWDGENLGDWASEFDDADVVINLAGRSVNCRYNAENRRIIKESRIKSTQVIGMAVKASKTPPKLWLQSSTATIYAHRYDAPNDEETGILGGNEPNSPDTWLFSIDVAKSWEKTFDEIVLPNTRKVKLRSAIVMNPDSGSAFDTLLTLVRYGLGGTNADGKQYVSWIHYKDFIEAINWLIKREDISGVVNIASPNPLPNKDFMAILRKAWGMPLGLPATEWMLEIGAIILGTETELILKSRRVVPSRLLKEGFSFQFPTWLEAAESLCQEWSKK